MPGLITLFGSEKSLHLNGKAIHSNTIKYDDIKNGGLLEFEMTDDPEDIAFNIYLKMIGAVKPNNYIKINKYPILSSTNYIDKGKDYHGPAGSAAKIHEAHQ